MKYIGTKELETSRLILRRLKVDDYKTAYDNWCSNENVARYTLWKKHENSDITKSLFTMWERDYENLDTFRWIVILKDTNEAIGTIDVASKNYLIYDTAEIGYCYGEKFWGNGYATEALKRVIKYLFEEVELKTIYATYMEKNPKSGRVMIKAGMNYEGKLISRVIDGDGIRNRIESCSITIDDYNNKKELYENI